MTVSLESRACSGLWFQPPVQHEHQCFLYPSLVLRKHSHLTRKIRDVKQDSRIIMTHEKKNMILKCDEKDKAAFEVL